MGLTQVRAARVSIETRCKSRPKSAPSSASNSLPPARRLRFFLCSGLRSRLGPWAQIRQLRRGVRVTSACRAAKGSDQRGLLERDVISGGRVERRRRGVTGRSRAYRLSACFSACRRRPRPSDCVERYEACPARRDKCSAGLVLEMGLMTLARCDTLCGRYR